jgi:hydroxyacylglutathione hydrolase
MILAAGGGLEIHCLPLGELMTNCYVLVADTALNSPSPEGDSPHRPVQAPAAQAKTCWIVDPGLSPAPLLDYLRRKALSPQRILLTHGHGDHIAGVAAVKQAYPCATITCPAADAHMLTDPMANMSLPFGFDIAAPPPEQTVAPGDELQMAALRWQVLEAAGHTPGGVAYYCQAAGVVLTGDSLFAGSIGRTDIPGASEARLLKNIQANLFALPEATRVLPGHGPPSTIGQERRSNPFLRP